MLYTKCYIRNVILKTLYTVYIVTTSINDIPKKVYKISRIKCRYMLYKIVHGMTLDL